MRSFFDDLSPLQNWFEREASKRSYVRSDLDFNLQQNENGDLLVQLSLPGIKTDQIQAWLEQNELRVEVTAPEESDGKVRYLHKGIRTGSKQFRLSLGSDYKVDSARHQDGIMELLLKRLRPEPAHRIEIPIQSQHSANQEPAQLEQKAG